MSTTIAHATVEGDVATPRPDVRFGAIVAAIYLTTLLPRVLVHVMWRDEWQAWMLAVPTPPLGELFGRLRYEGHPSLWHLLIWLAAHVWPNPVVMKLLSAALAAGVVFVVAGFAPFSRGVRVLICLGYFVLFEYAVVSRNYGLGVLPLLCFAALATYRPRAWVWQGVALALAANANLFATILAAAAGVVVVARWFRDGRPEAGRFALGATILVVGMLLCLWQLWPPADRMYAEYVYGLNVERGGRALAGFWRSFVPIPYPGRFWWGNNLVDATIREGSWLKPVQPLLGLGVLALVTWLLPRRPAPLAVWAIGVTAMMAMLYVVFPGGLRHQGHWPVLALLSLWIGGGFASLSPLKRRLWVGLFAVSAVGGLAASAADVLLPFSASRAAGRYIAANYSPDVTVMGGVDFAVSPVSGVLDRPLYHTSGNGWGTYLVWNDHRRPSVYPPTLVEQARRLHAEARAAGRDDTVLLLVSRPDRHPNPPTTGPEIPPEFAPVAAFDDATVEDERYRLFEFTGVPEPTTRLAP